MQRSRTERQGVVAALLGIRDVPSRGSITFDNRDVHRGILRGGGGVVDGLRRFVDVGDGHHNFVGGFLVRHRVLRGGLDRQREVALRVKPGGIRYSEYARDAINRETL